VAPARTTWDLRPFLVAIGDTGSVARARSLLNEASGPPRSDAVWPIYVFLTGEVRRATGDVRRARIDYRTLAEWGAGDPYRDGWGGSGLAAVALWRWLELADSSPVLESTEAESLLRTGDALRRTRLARGMAATPLLESLPQIEEQTVRSLTKVAWTSGQAGEAQRLFLDYLTVVTTSELTPLESQLLDRAIQSGAATRDRLTLLRGQSLAARGRYSEAGALLCELLDSKDRGARAAAVISLARGGAIIDRCSRLLMPRDRANLLEQVLDDADPTTAQRALLNRALVLNRDRRSGARSRYRARTLRAAWVAGDRERVHAHPVQWRRHGDGR
jgi:hypothetical protein